MADNYGDREFTVRGFPFTAKPIPYMEGRPIFDIIRCAVPRMLEGIEWKEVKVSEGETAINTELIPLVGNIVGGLTVEEVTQLEDRIYNHVFVKIEGVDLPQKLANPKTRNKVFGTDIIMGYEVLVRSFCAQFFRLLNRRPIVQRRAEYPVAETPNVDPVIAAVASYFKKPPSEVECMTLDEVADANEVIWYAVENERSASEHARGKGKQQLW